MNGQEFQELRNQAGLSQNGFANLTGCNINTVKKWEQSTNSIAPNPCAAILVKALASKMLTAEQVKELYEDLL